LLKKRTPLDQISRGATHAAAVIARSGLCVVPVTDSGLLLLQGESEDSLLDEVLLGQFGLRLPGRLGTSVRGDYALVWLAPKEWLLELPIADTPAVKVAVSSRLAPPPTVLTDISDSLAGFDVTGEHAWEVLMTGCSLDLRPHAFTAGRVARTAIADVPAIIFKRGTLPQFRCWVDRSFAAHFWNWLAENSTTWSSAFGTSGSTLHARRCSATALRP
jgi:heterotetrameric sarcosine oxidase gamma subunit